MLLCFKRCLSIHQRPDKLFNISNRWFCWKPIIQKIRNNYSSHHFLSFVLDGNMQIVILCYAIAQFENTKNWSWFLSLLDKDIARVDAHKTLSIFIVEKIYYYVRKVFFKKVNSWILIDVTLKHHAIFLKNFDNLGNHYISSNAHAHCIYEWFQQRGTDNVYDVCWHEVLNITLIIYLFFLLEEPLSDIMILLLLHLAIFL